MHGSVCRYFEDLSGKNKFRNPTVHVSSVSQGTHIRCKYDEHVLFRRSWQPAQARKDPCLFFRAHDPDRSHGFWLKCITLLHKETQHLPLKNPTESQLYFEHVSFSKNRTVFSQIFRGSVCRYFEDLSAKKFQNPTVRAYRSFVKEPAYAVSTTKWSFEAASSLKPENILAFFLRAHVPDRSHGFLLKLRIQSSERSLDGRPPAKWSRRSPMRVERVAQTVRRRSTSPHGKEKDLDRRNRRLPPGEEVTRSWAFMSYHSKTACFQARRSTPQNKVSQWGFLWVERSIGRRGSWADHSEATKLSEWAEHRNEATKLSAASRPRSEATLSRSRATGAKRQSWAERECPSNAGWIITDKRPRPRPLIYLNFLPSVREHTEDPSWFSVLMINGGEEFSWNGLIPVQSSCIGIIPVKELGAGCYVFPGRSSLRAVFTCISVRYQAQKIFVNCPRVHIKKRNQRQIAFSNTWTRQGPCGLEALWFRIQGYPVRIPPWSTLYFCNFFLYVSPIWLLQEQTTGKDRTCDIYRGCREELALGEVWRGYSTKEGVEGIYM